jgi:hypothetical protein
VCISLGKHGHGMEQRFVVLSQPHLANLPADVPMAIRRSPKPEIHPELCIPQVKYQ